MYIQVNIGRNVNETPMSDTDWQDFQTRVTFALIFSANDTNIDLLAFVEIHLGQGSYDGLTEESAHLSAFSETGFDIGHLTELLKEIKAAYQQDAIALITGSELI